MTSPSSSQSAPFAPTTTAALRPYVSDSTHWLAKHRDVFQGYYNAVSSGATATRARPGGHRAYQATIDFCDKYDQAAFDPVMRSMPLEPFDPIVRRVHARPLPSWNRMWQD